MMKTSARFSSLGGMAVGPLGAVGAGGTGVAVRAAVALGALVGGAAAVTVGALTGGVAAAGVAVASAAAAVDAGVTPPWVLAPAGVLGGDVGTEGAGAQALTAASKHNNPIQRS